LGNHRTRNTEAFPSTKQTNSELESYTNNTFNDMSVESSSNTNTNGVVMTRRRSLSNRNPGKIINSGNVANNNNNDIKEEKEPEAKDKEEETKVSNESLKSNQSEKSDKSEKGDKSLKNKLSTNAKKMFFLSFKSKKKTTEENKDQPQQKDILVSTMKKRYEKNSSKAQK